MAESDKMMALKKAYAGIILNTAKEAAARVLISEKRAIRCQQDLSSTKDEALRLLVHLKQMIDAKTMEAEIASINKQKKIDELEAQLHEAEDIITDLRSELTSVQDKLERVKKNKLPPLNGEISTDDASFMKDSMPLHDAHPPLSFDLRTDILNPNNSDDKCCKASKQDEKSDVSHLESKYEHNTGINSMLMRSKKPELYRNGCTQRIRALDRKLLDEKLPPAEGMEDPSSMLLSMETMDEHEDNCMISSPKTKGARLMKFTREEVNKPVKSRPSRRRKTRFTRVKSASRRLLASLPKKPSQSSSEAKINTFPCLNNITSVKTLNKCRLIQNAADRDVKLRDESVSLAQDADTKVFSTLPSSELSSDMVDAKEAKASEETDASPTEVANERVLKYTFQRKRKKEPSSDCDEKTSAENSNLKRRASWRQDDDDAQETEKSSLMNEMSKDIRRMAQVARQLISLSGKRWQ